MTVPGNVCINRRRLPNGWSHPLQTQQLLSALGEFHHRLHITYNAFDRDSEERFLVLRLYWYGHERKEPFFGLGVESCRSHLRANINESLRSKVLPYLAAWCHKVAHIPRQMGLYTEYRQGQLAIIDTQFRAKHFFEVTP